MFIPAHSKNLIAFRCLSNFNSIVVAIREGRRLFTNIQRFLLHLLSTNVAEVMVLIIGLCFLDEHGTSVFPLSPIAILWVNMITSGPPAFGLGLEKASLDSMRRGPHLIKDGVFSWPVIIDMMAYGVVMGTTSLLSVSGFLSKRRRRAQCKPPVCYRRIWRGQRKSWIQLQP